MKSLKHNDICYPLKSITSCETKIFSDTEHKHEIGVGTIFYASAYKLFEILCNNAKNMGINPAFISINNERYECKEEKPFRDLSWEERAEWERRDMYLANIAHRIKCEIVSIDDSEARNENNVPSWDYTTHDFIDAKMHCNIRFYDKNMKAIRVPNDIMKFKCSYYLIYWYARKKPNIGIGTRFYEERTVSQIRVPNMKKEYRFRVDPIEPEFYFPRHEKYNDLICWNYRMSHKGLCMGSFRKIEDEQIIDHVVNYVDAEYEDGDSCFFDNDKLIKNKYEFKHSNCAYIDYGYGYIVIKIFNKRENKKFHDWRNVIKSGKIHSRSWKETTKKHKQWM